MTESKREKFLRKIMQVIFVVYILLLMRFILFKYAPLTSLWDAFFLRKREYNIIPLKATYRMIRGLSPMRLVENIAGNIILFVPFGILLPLANALPFYTASPQVFLWKLSSLRLQWAQPILTTLF